ncbi:MAG: histidine kinase [Acidobacteria bacterium]|nr:histidine kinase [Acidobacteriota bacterium]
MRCILGNLMCRVYADKLLSANLRRGLGLATCLAVTMGAPAAVFAANDALAGLRRTRSVLVVEPDRLELPAYAEINSAFRTALRDASDKPVQVFFENLDLARFNRERYLDDMGRWLATKYRDRQLDALVAVGPSAYRAVAQWRPDLWPGVPMVFAGVDRNTFEAVGRLPNVTGIWAEFGHLDTVRVALELLPATRHLVIVGGMPRQDPLAGVLAAELVEAFGDKLEIVDLTGQRIDLILERTRQLPDDSIILLTSMTVDGAGQPFSGLEVCTLLDGEANAPIFGWLSTYLGAGVVGGMLLDLEAIGLETAELLGHVLSGEDAGSIDVVPSNANRLAFDWRQLEKWRIPRRRLPEGSSVELRPPSVWEEHRGTILQAIIIMGLQGVLILALLRSRQRRLEANRELHMLSGRLITAQEDERWRVARELHDDIGQRLALLAIECESGPMNGDGLGELSSKVNDLARDVYAIAHNLQPSRLESLGLAAELRAYCEEIERRLGMRVRCRVAAPSTTLPSAISLSLYRVVQEAVQNAVRHSGADEIDVELDVSPRWASVTIADNGRGLKWEDAERNLGLGITGMKERLRLVEGWLDLQSIADEGTTVTAWAPLHKENGAKASDGAAADSDR